MDKVTITLTKSLIGRKPNQIKTVKALGLTKIGSSVVKDDTEAIRGMVASIAHLVKIEETK
jgi:large subunit ribosomal protein L30